MIRRSGSRLVRSLLAAASVALSGAAVLAAKEAAVLVLDVPAATAGPGAVTAAAGAAASCATAPHDGAFESAVGFLPSQNAAHIAQRFALPPGDDGATWFLDDVCLAVTRNGAPAKGLFAFAVFRDEGGLPGDVVAFRRIEAEIPAFPGSTVCLGDFSVSLIGLDAIHVGVSWDPQQLGLHVLMDESPGTAAQTVSLRASASGPEGLGVWSPATAVRPAIRSAGVGITLFGSEPEWAATALGPPGAGAVEPVVSLAGGPLVSLGSAAAGPRLAAAGTQRLLGGVAREARLGSLVVALLVFGDPATPPPAPQTWYSYVGPRDDPAAGVFEKLELPFPAAWFVGDELTPWHGDPTHFVVPVADHQRKLRLLHVRLGGAGSGGKSSGMERGGPEADAGPTDTTGRITGRVTDETGSPLAGATVTALNGELGLERTATTGPNGEFLFALLPVGGYQVVVAAPGRLPQTFNFRLGIGQTVPLDVSLAPGSVVEEEITVTGELFSTEDPVIVADLTAVPSGESGEDESLCLGVQTTRFEGQIFCRRAGESWRLVRDLAPPVVSGSNGALFFDWGRHAAAAGEATGAACLRYGRATSQTTFDDLAICTDTERTGQESKLGSHAFVPHGRRASMFDLGIYAGGAHVEAWFAPEPQPETFGIWPENEAFAVTCHTLSRQDLSLQARGSYLLPADVPTGKPVDFHAEVDSFGNLALTHPEASGGFATDAYRHTGDCDWEFAGSYGGSTGSAFDRGFVPIEEFRDGSFDSFSLPAPTPGEYRDTSFDSFRSRSIGDRSYLLGDEADDLQGAKTERLAEGSEPQASKSLPAPVTFLESRVPRPCAPGAATQCLNDERFGLEVGWRIPDGQTGVGQAVPLTGDSGLFTFFGAENVELFAKVLDACVPFGELWVFSAGLTNVEYALAVTDSASGRVRHYANPLGRSAQPQLDTGAFDTCASTAPGELPAWARAALARRGSPQAAPVIPETNGACASTPTALCLAGGRFRVEAEWDTGDAAGDGQAIPLTGDTGAFWFFGSDNVEVLLKVVDACVDPFDRFWVFAAGLTNVDVRLVVTDTESGERRHYRNLPGHAFIPIQDTDAFATCP